MVNLTVVLFEKASDFIYDFFLSQESRERIIREVFILILQQYLNNESQENDTLNDYINMD